MAVTNSTTRCASPATLRARRRRAAASGACRGLGCGAMLMGTRCSLCLGGLALFRDVGADSVELVGRAEELVAAGDELCVLGDEELAGGAEVKIGRMVAEELTVDPRPDQPPI